MVGLWGNKQHHVIYLNELVYVLLYLDQQLGSRCFSSARGGEPVNLPGARRETPKHRQQPWARCKPTGYGRAKRLSHYNNFIPLKMQLCPWWPSVTVADLGAECALAKVALTDTVLDAHPQRGQNLAKPYVKSSKRELLCSCYCAIYINFKRCLSILVSCFN